ncbi:hypothetical protein EWW49_00325 [Pseudomonas syringae]|uniref:GreA/GreB family elongation factor n=1 Tax=Pseudomonas sp. MWU16-30316 TaxID=2878093 RepID=UPI00110440B7|nr:GreA/GreB family elongation factor [Pseudomonas sp. MWU16-30316]TFZ37796.1 hypothetical protein EWW49_00325 [Pseudomonas syringae]
MSTRFYLSRKGLERLSAQRDQLREDLQRSTKEMGESVKRDNDLRENPEYMQLQTKVSYELPNKIAEITKILDTHLLIEDTEAIKNGLLDEVQVGMQVTLVDEEGAERLISILGYEESNPEEGVVSYLTPVAKILIHKGVGDEVELPVAGKPVSYEITAISRSPSLI